MKPRLSPRSRFLPLALIAGGAMLLGGSASARDYIRIPLPPPPREVFENVRNFFHRVGDRVRDSVNRAFDRTPEKEKPETRSRGKSQTAKKPGWDGAKRSVPYRYDDADSFTARDDSAPAERRSGATSGSDVPPVTVVGPQQPSDQAPPSTKPPETTTAPPEPAETSRPAPPPVNKALEAGNLPFGSPVSGKRGLVYPPGAKHTQENMVDVTDFKPGQIVRDPRTGELFRVP